MIPLIKLLKIVLPVTTVTAATIATVSLVSFQKADNKLDKEAEDKVLEDFEIPAEKFEEQKMLYAKDGQGNNVAIKDEKQKQQLLEELAKNNGKLEQSDEVPGELKERGSNNPSEGSQMENKEGDAPKIADSENKPFDEDQSEPDVSINLPSTSAPKNDLVEGDSENDTLQEGAKDSEKGLDDQEQKLNEPETSSESVDRDESGPKADTKPQDSVQDMPEKSEESTGTDDLSKDKNTLLETEPSVQENEDGSENNTDVQAKVDNQLKSNRDNLGGDESNSSQSDQDGVTNEAGREPITPERLDELIKLGDSASSALDDLKRLLLR